MLTGSLYSPMVLSRKSVELSGAQCIMYINPITESIMQINRNCLVSNLYSFLNRNEGSSYSTDFFCYANKIFVTQKSCFATLIKFLLRKKVVLLR